MVDVGDKPATSREALAECMVRMAPATLRAVREGTPKGDALQVARIAGIGKEQLLAADFIVGDSPLPFGGGEPVDERLTLPDLNARMFGRIHQHDTVPIEQTPIAFDQHAQFASIFECKPRSTIRQHMGIRFGSDIERCTHSLADFAIPAAFDRAEVDAAAVERRSG